MATTIRDKRNFSSTSPKTIESGSIQKLKSGSFVHNAIGSNDASDKSKSLSSRCLSIES